MDNILKQHFSGPEEAYIISQTDPFHDFPYRLEGAPSSLATQSMVMCVNSEVTVSSADFGLPATPGSKWDLHIAMLPVSTPLQVNAANAFTPGALRNTADAFTNALVFGPITMCGVGSGALTFNWASTGDNVKYKILPNDYPTNLVQVGSGGGIFGRGFREIARAFEIVDSTPTIYQQGTVTCYELSGEVIDRQITFSPIAQSTTSTVTNNRQSTLLRTPANSLPQASRVPGSKTWKTSEGVYCVARKTVEEIPFSQITGQPVIFAGLPEGANSAGQTKTSFISVSATTQSAPTTSMSTAYTPYGSYGAYMTGLSGEYGTYRVRLKQFFEIVATPTDFDILPLMTPTLPRNPVLEDLIEQTLSRLPAFVPQTMNPKGEAWRQVLRTTGKVLKAAGMISSSLGNPSLGNALEVVGKEVNKAGVKPRGKPKPKQPKAQPKGGPTQSKTQA